ncbi:Crp/Fnr family transcriptional regulator [Halosquirtibacter xylanolyticus]|uniref:Crp/Fnr family transcriptional regulator n=1 Tax=Halosquirtibacter xylanolyticus TaxID=3374599 RepID=UPI003748DE85|nr:Crp/Fnr family transcriptional regulator [Prolixibacteraceae bacterium]
MWNDENLLDKLKENQAVWIKINSLFVEQKIAPKTLLLREGEISNNFFFIKKGCLRESSNHDGKDITFQFFFEGEAVASIDSFIEQKPSLFSIETIEQSTILLLKRENYLNILKNFPDIQNTFQDLLFKRFRIYGELFISRIKNTPQELYKDLIDNHSEIIKRIPQHYIASYLGITPISLSRIRNRKQ